MYVDNFSEGGPYDSNLGFSLNPIKNIQQVAQKVQAVVVKVAPPIVAKLSPTNVIAQQAADIAAATAKANALAKEAAAKADALAREAASKAAALAKEAADKAATLALRAAQEKASAIYKATAASPLGAKLVTPMLDAGAIKSPIGRQLMPSITANINAQQQLNAQAQATYDAQVAAQAKAQAAADAQWERDRIQYEKDQASQQATWEANHAQLTSNNWSADTEQIDPSWSNAPTQSDPYASYAPVTGGGGYVSQDDLSPLDMSTPDIENALPVDENLPAPVSVKHWWDWWLTPIKPIGKPATPAAPETAQVAPWDPYSLSNDYRGDNMQLSNIPSKRNLPSGTFARSGLGDIWGDLMTTAADAYKQKTAVQIQQSQAAQADASARIAAANAAALNAQNRPALSTPVMLASAAALAGVLFFMRKKRRA